MVSHFNIVIILMTAAGVDNPAFIPEMDNTAVAPSQRAQGRPPWTTTNLRHLAPLRSSRSTDSIPMADASVDEEASEEKPGKNHTRL